MPNYLKEAFKELELLDEEVFPFNKDGAVDLQKFLDGDITDDTESIIDPEADSEEDLQKSYEGKVIISCKICHDMQYKDPQDIVIDEESDYVNVGEECPSCSSVDGYKIVGQVAPYCAECDKESEDNEATMVESRGNEFDVKYVSGGATYIDSNIQAKDKEDALKKFKKKHKNDKTPVERVKEVSMILHPVDENEIPIEESLNEKRETGLADVVQQMLDGEFYDMVKSKKTGKMQSVGRPPIVNATDIGVDENGLAVLVKDDETAAKVKEVADKFGLETKYEPAHRYDRDKRAVVHIYISEEDWDKDVSDIAFGDNLGETLVTDCSAKNNRPYLKGNKDRKEPITEAVENVTVETDSDTVTVTPTEGGDVKVETQSKETIEPEVETIVPVDAETKDEIDMNDHNFDDTATDDLDLDDIELDAEEFDSLGESYLKKVYGNVESYKTSTMKKEDGKLMFEGVITFASGKKAKTSFIFENIVKTRSGKIKFIGENLHLTNNKRAFTITASVNGKKGICESFNYNYIAKDSATGKKVPLYGTIKK